MMQKYIMTMILICQMLQTYGADREITIVTKDATSSSRFSPNGKGPFIIGNKSFDMKDLVSLTPEQQEIFMQAARPDRLKSCLTGTNNQLFCKPAGVYWCSPKECCSEGADVNELKKLPPHIKQGLKVQVTNDDPCVAYKCFVMPGTLTTLCITPASLGCTPTSCAVVCCFVSCPAVTACLIQRMKQWFWSKTYSVEKDEYLEE
jgi:hypothetical protein